MRMIALLRGVTPTGRNRIPSMAELAQCLKAAGFGDVRTYIQSGNVLLDTPWSVEETAERIHHVIIERIGADLAVILKTKEQLCVAAAENPFGASFDRSRVHLVFTNDRIEETKLAALEDVRLEGEVFKRGTSCLYMYLPRNAVKKTLNTNYLERKLGITATMRKLNVIEHLTFIAQNDERARCQV